MNHFRQATTETSMHITLLIIVDKLDVVSSSELHTIQVQRLLTIRHRLIHKTVLIHQVTSQSVQLRYREGDRRIQLSRIITKDETQLERLANSQSHCKERHLEGVTRESSHIHAHSLLRRTDCCCSRYCIEGINRRHELHKRKRDLLLVINHKSSDASLIHRSSSYHSVYSYTHSWHLIIDIIVTSSNSTQVHVTQLVLLCLLESEVTIRERLRSIQLLLGRSITLSTSLHEVGTIRITQTHTMELDCHRLILHNHDGLSRILYTLHTQGFHSYSMETIVTRIPYIALHRLSDIADSNIRVRGLETHRFISASYAINHLQLILIEQLQHELR